MIEFLNNNAIRCIQQESLTYDYEIRDVNPMPPIRSITITPNEYKPGDIFLDWSKFEVNKKLIPERIIFNPPATIVFWNDGTKTVVKAAEDTEFNHYWGFCSALAIKMFGSNHAVKSMIRKNCNVKLDKQLTPIIEA